MKKAKLYAKVRVWTVGLLRPPRLKPKKKPYTRKIKHKGERYDKDL